MYSVGHFWGSVPIINDTNIVNNGSVFRRAYAYEQQNKWQYRRLYDGAIERFETRLGDYGTSGWTPGMNDRSEVVVNQPLVANKPESIIAFEEEAWLSYSFMVETPTTSDFSIVGQWHDYPEPEDVHMSPPLSFVLYKSTTVNGVTTIPMAMATLFDSNFSSTINNPNYRTRWSGTIEMGKWSNFVLNFKPSLSGTGFLKLWKDGVLVCNIVNTNFGFNNATGFGYWQYGIYRASDPNTCVVYYANTEVGRTSLLSRVTAPKKIFGYP